MDARAEYERFRASQAREALDKVRREGCRLAAAREAVDAMRARAEGVAAVRYDAPRVSRSIDADRSAEAVADLVDASAAYVSGLAEFEAMRHRANRIIERMPSPELRRALRLRYLCGRSVDATAAAMGYTRSGFNNLHRRALLEFADAAPASALAAIPEAV